MWWIISKLMWLKWIGDQAWMKEAWRRHEWSAALWMIEGTTGIELRFGRKSREIPHMVRSFLLRSDPRWRKLLGSASNAWLYSHCSTKLGFVQTSCHIIRNRSPSMPRPASSSKSAAWECLARNVLIMYFIVFTMFMRMHHLFFSMLNDTLYLDNNFY